MKKQLFFTISNTEKMRNNYDRKSKIFFIAEKNLKLVKKKSRITL